MSLHCSHPVTKIWKSWNIDQFNQRYSKRCQENVFHSVEIVLTISVYTSSHHRPLILTKEPSPGNSAILQRAKIPTFCLPRDPGEGIYSESIRTDPQPITITRFIVLIRLLSHSVWLLGASHQNIRGHALLNSVSC